MRWWERHHSQWRPHLRRQHNHGTKPNYKLRSIDDHISVSAAAGIEPRAIERKKGRPRGRPFCLVQFFAFGSLRARLGSESLVALGAWCAITTRPRLLGQSGDTAVIDDRGLPVGLPASL